MLKHIELKNFRKHAELVIDFSQGLNVIRGANEAGKSTLLEGVLYALYGSKGLRNSLAETVTWGRKDSELAVKLIIHVNGLDYTFTRSKAGAECNYTVPNGAWVKVTGQNEVTAYAAELLGADAKTAALLMLSSQSGLRGALDDGPAAVSALMGKLANFDLIDSIVEAASTKLALGSAAPVQAKLAEAQASLDSALAAIPDPATLTELQVEIDAQATVLAVMEQHAADALQPAVVEADMALATARDTYTAWSQAVKTAKGASEKVDNEHARLDHAQADAGKRPDPAKIAALRLDVQRATTNEGHLKAHRQFLALPAYPTNYWDKPKADFDAEYKRLSDELAASKAACRDVAVEISVLKRSYITNGKCPTCGAVSMADEHVKAKNAEIDTQIAVLNAKVASLAAPVSGHSETLSVMDGIRLDARSRTDAYARIHSYIEVDESQYPPLATWKGAVPSPMDLAGLQVQLQQLEAAERAATQAQGRVDALKQSVADAEAALAAAQAHMNSFTPVNLEPLEQALATANQAYAEASQKIRDLTSHVVGMRSTKAQLEQAGERAALAVAHARSRVAEYEQDIKRLEFNNGLVNKLRKLKPAITDHLWNTVLAAVSNFFSTLRGEQSVVTKDASGFRVNGQSIESLSGSTIDVLALAIRVALSKTFIPHASFMVLDEPAHGCDDTRTGNVLGFLSSVGFTQTILASHDELSEAVADHVIALGA